MDNIKLPKGATHLTVGFDGNMSKMSPEQRVAMASLNEQAKKRQEEIDNFKKETPMKEELTPLLPAPTADEAAKVIPGPAAEEKFLPDPLEPKTTGPVTLPGIEAEEAARQVTTNFLRYTQDTLADEFARIFRDEIMALRNAGQKEYAHDDGSPFANFERGAKDMGIDRKQVLWCYAMKHKDGIAAALKGHTSQREDVRGRINDLIVYLLLLRGIFNEESGNTGNFGLGDLSK